MTRIVTSTEAAARVRPPGQESRRLEKLRGPNDLVFDAHGGFWFTDLGKVRTHDMDRGRVYYARADGSHIHEAAYPLFNPNGIGLSPDETELYVAGDTAWFERIVLESSVGDTAALQLIGTGWLGLEFLIGAHAAPM